MQPSAQCLNLINFRMKIKILIYIFTAFCISKLFASVPQNAYDEFCSDIYRISPWYCDSNGSALINSIIAVDDLDGDVNVWIFENNIKRDFKLKDVKLRKAMSIALLRAVSIDPNLILKEYNLQIKRLHQICINSDNNAWRLFQTDLSDSLIYFFSNSKLMENIGYSIKRGEERFFPNIFPEGMHTNLLGYQYSRELASIVRNVLKLDDDLPPEKLPFLQLLEKHLKECTIDELAKKYDFYNENKERAIEFQAGRLGSEKYKIASVKAGAPLILFGDRSNEFLVALLRLRLSVTNLRTISFPYDDSVKSLNGAIIELQMKLPDGSRYLIYVKSGMKDAVGVHAIESSNEVTTVGMPSDGIYYSPEFYRMVISVFADISRKEYLEKNMK